MTVCNLRQSRPLAVGQTTLLAYMICLETMKIIGDVKMKEYVSVTEFKNESVSVSFYLEPEIISEIGEKMESINEET